MALPIARQAAFAQPAVQRTDDEDLAVAARLPVLAPMAALALVAAPSLARADEDAQGWVNLSAAGRVAGPVLMQADASIRSSDAADGLAQIDLALVLGREIAPGVELYGGYVRSLRYSRTAPTTVENRPRVQLNADLLTIAGGALDLRWRGEMRMREDIPNDTAWRTRVQLRWVRPFRHGGRTALVLGHESFVNFNRTRFAAPGYDRMRNFALIRLPLTREVRMEVGYLNQHRFVRGGRDLSEHNAQFNLGWSF